MLWGGPCWVEKAHVRVDEAMLVYTRPMLGYTRPKLGTQGTREAFPELILPPRRAHFGPPKAALKRHRFRDPRNADLYTHKCDLYGPADTFRDFAP